MKLNPTIRQLQIGITIGLVLAVLGFIVNNPIVGWLGVILALLFGRFYIVFKEKGHLGSTFSSGLWSTVFILMSLYWGVNFFITTFEKVGLLSPIVILVILLGFTLVIGLHIVVERLYSRRVHSFMAQKIPDQEMGANQTFTEAEASTTTSPPPTELVFRTFGLNDELPQLSEESETFYKRALNERGQLLFKGLLVALLINFLVSVGIFTYIFSLGETLEERSIHPILTGMAFHVPAFLLA